MAPQYPADHDRALRDRMGAAVRQPRNLNEYIRWWRREWEAECPPRLHQRGVEPESALGAPALYSQFREYLMGSPLATDHDDRLDATTADAVRRLPCKATLAIMRRGGWYKSATFLFALGFRGAEWQDIILAWHILPEIGHRFAHDTLRHAWVIWSRDAMGLT